jgi:rSAM/selenodomain-associated transferase 2
MKISIIVPVLNEAESLRAFLADLRKRAPKAEIIVVDGGSDDGTLALANDLAGELSLRALRSERGRAKQMNAGAASAAGDVFWFVHADTRIPRTAIADIESALKDRHVVGGFFRMRFPRERFIYRFSDSIGHYVGVLVGIRYGDHAFFCQRKDFFATGGYPDVPLFEDAEFYRRLRRRGRTRHLRSEIITSPHRYEQLGPYRLTASYLLLSALYLFRVPIPVLVRIYNRLCLSAGERPHLANRE